MISRILCIPMALAAITSLPPRAQSSSAPAAAPIFDGKTLNGWEGDPAIFRVESGAIVGGSLLHGIKRNEFLCTTRTYRDFELRLMFKLLGGKEANAGVQFRTRRIPGSHEVIGYQADIGEGHWGSLYDESRRRRTLKAPDSETVKRLVKTGDWNQYAIRAEGNHIQLWLNGARTVDYIERDTGIDADGVIALQIHAGPPSEAWYRDITLVELGQNLRMSPADALAKSRLFGSGARKSTSPKVRK